MNKKSLRIGLFTILTLVATFLLVNFLKGNDFLKGSYTYHAQFAQVEGLNPASPVYIRGFKVGSLKGIEYNKSSNLFVVHISIKEDFEIPEDSRVEIFSSDILGGRAIRILEGNSPKPADEGAFLPSDIVPDALGNLMNSLEPLAEGANLLIADLRQSIGQINDIISDKNTDQINQLLQGLNVTVNRMQAIAASVQEEDIRNIVTNIHQISNHLDSTLLSTGQTIKNIEEITGQLSQAELDQFIQSLKSLSDGLQNPQGSVGKMMQTDDMHQAMLSLTNDIDSLIKKIEENPKKYLKISIF